ncbi:MAG: IS4 family transposase, partial [Ghiorsea sp.]|nr:IS4 family transposase [Ghiorsea sp.]
ANLLPDSLLEKIRQCGSDRDTVFTPLVTLKAFLWQVLSPSGSCKGAVAHVLTDRLSFDHPANSMNTGPYCKARQRLSLHHLKAAVSSSGKALHKQASSSWLWKGFRVLLVDGTTLLMPDTEDNQTHYPQQSVQKKGLGFPIMRMVGLLSLATGSCVDYVTGAYQGKGSGETSLFAQLIGNLGKQDLLLADRYYTTFAIMACLIQQGTPCVLRQRANVKSDFRLGEKLSSKDHIISYHKPKKKPVWMTQEAYDELPDEIKIREFSVNGTVYVTTLLDAKTYHKNELAKLYKERWNVELDFRSIKTHMGMEMLRCKSANMVEKEVAAHLLAYNLIRSNMANAANQNGVKPREISFMAAVNLMRSIVEKTVNLTSEALEKWVEQILNAIAYTKIGGRKRKSQPRVMKQRPKAYPLMTKPRDEYAK